jgi:16S rRNA (cytosine967-C5)-methyltransferase
VACDALVRIEDGAYSHVVLPTMLRGSSLSQRDRAFVTDLVYGTVRSQRRLDALLAPHGRRPIRRLDPPVRAALRIGAHQLVHGVPAHAAVSATVDAAPSRARGYVNAVLRALSTTGPPWPEPANGAVALSYPDWIVELLEEDLGVADARDALAASNEPGAVSLRPNPLRTTPKELLHDVQRGRAHASPGRLVPDALTVRGAGDLGELPAVTEGRATPQDQASQAVVRHLGPLPGDRVLDVASAPGGKATGAAELVGPGGQVVALDVDAGRLRLVRRSADRLRLTNVSLVRGDSRNLAVTSETFDRVLVDAPCSGLGALGRRPDLRWQLGREAIEPLGALQVLLVLEAARAVRPGGRLVYSVCTMTRRETIDVADRVIDRLPGFAPLTPPKGWRPWGPGGLVLPQDHGTDAMFVFGLQRA